MAKLVIIIHVISKAWVASYRVLVLTCTHDFLSRCYFLIPWLMTASFILIRATLGRRGMQFLLDQHKLASNAPVIS